MAARRLVWHQSYAMQSNLTYSATVRTLMDDL